MTLTEKEIAAIGFITSLEDLVVKHTSCRAMRLTKDQWVRWYDKAISAKANLPYDKWEWASLVIYDIQRIIEGGY